MYMAEKKQHRKVSSGNKGFRKKFSPKAVTVSFGYEIAGIYALLSNKKSKMFLSAGLLYSLLIMGWPTGREVLP